MSHQSPHPISGGLLRMHRASFNSCHPLGNTERILILLKPFNFASSKAAPAIKGLVSWVPAMALPVSNTICFRRLNISARSPNNVICSSTRLRPVRSHTAKLTRRSQFETSVSVITCVISPRPMPVRRTRPAYHTAPLRWQCHRQ